MNSLLEARVTRLHSVTRHAVVVGGERVCVGDVVQTMSAGAAGLHFTCAPPDSSDRPSTVGGLSWALRAEMGEE
jgi:hypothetical protein